MVKPPALYRSPLFSLGLFVLAFLVWACADSWESWTRCLREVTLHNGKATAGLAGDGVAIYGGKLVLSWTSATMRPDGVTLSRENFIYARSPLRLSGARFAKPALQKREDELPSWGMIIRREVEIPMWVVVATYFVLWCGVMVWRRRRWRRLAGAAAGAAVVAVDDHPTP